MQRVYIHRNGKDILLTEQEMWQVYRTCKEFEEEQELKLYKEFVVKGLIDIGYPIVAKNEKFVYRFAEYMYRLVTQKDCDFDWCFNTGEYGGFRECYSDCVDIVEGQERMISYEN